ncbi:hypothetical protein CWR45_02155 [Oceanobacillus chungangensis]|uniref:Uncharacterized protein n=1 Tax=Oceanobacillus chungangensis TaxID=1229152 RepID=A0A3D8Q268_9BACI|nr:hypothetical protein CWR45_02155 [Oceanobacillus chungangensis]
MIFAADSRFPRATLQLNHKKITSDVSLAVAILVGVSCPPLQSTAIVSAFTTPISIVFAQDPAEEIHGDSCGRKGLGETLKCISTKRLTSRPRKA